MANLKTAVLVLVSTAAVALGVQPAGIWKITANAPDGRIYQATLAFVGLSATLSGPAVGVVPLHDIKVAGDELNFKMRSERNGLISFKLHAEGETLKGSFETANGDRGTVTGARPEAESPALDGKWKVATKRADGSDFRVTLDLSQTGSKLSGRVTTEDGDAADIEGVTQGGLVQLQVVTNDGSYDVSGEAAKAAIKGMYRSPDGKMFQFTAAR